MHESLELGQIGNLNQISVTFDVPSNIVQVKSIKGSSKLSFFRPYFFDAGIIEGKKNFGKWTRPCPVYQNFSFINH